MTLQPRNVGDDINRNSREGNVIRGRSQVVSHITRLNRGQMERSATRTTISTALSRAQTQISALLVALQAPASVEVNVSFNREDIRVLADVVRCLLRFLQDQLDAQGLSASMLVEDQHSPPSSPPANGRCPGDTASNNRNGERSNGKADADPCRGRRLGFLFYCDFCDREM